MGHGLYEHGVVPYSSGPCSRGRMAGSSRVAERMWENMVRRSLPFWDFAHPIFVGVFPTLGKTPPDEVYRSADWDAPR